MKRRKFLVGAGSTAVGGSALLGTGAFTRVESQRRAKIQVAKDAYAYLGLKGCPDSPNSSYTDVDDSGHLAIEMSPDNETDPGGLGVNSDSRSYFDDVFQICNNGKQEVCVWIEDDEDWPTYNDERRVEFYLGSSAGADDLTGLDSIIGAENAVPLDVGECICVGIATVTKGLTKGEQLLEDLENEIVIHADADAECSEVVPDPERFDIHLAYQDQDVDAGGDYDYNDWLVDIDATFHRAGGETPNNPGVTNLSGIDLKFSPLAKSAGLEHQFHLVDDNGIIGAECSGEYHLEVHDEEGNVVREESGSFNGGEETITIFESTNEVFDPEDAFAPNKWNADPEKEVGCAEPIRTARLELTFDEPCLFDFDAFDPVGQPSAPHGQGLFFNPTLTFDDGEVERGDLELLTVPDGWDWPVEDVSIWDVYDDVEEDNGTPDFPDDEWRPPLVGFEGDEDSLYDLC